MSTAQEAVADFAAETHPAYAGRMHYIEGYDPVSYEAPHSSLIRSSTWVGMGLVLAGLCPAGMMAWTGALLLYGNPGDAAIDPWPFFWIGLVLMVIFETAGTVLIHRGRRFYRQYRAETGRTDGPAHHFSEDDQLDESRTAHAG